MPSSPPDTPNLQTEDSEKTESENQVDYKEKLDEAARKVKEQGPKDEDSSIVAKVSKYVPGLEALIGGSDESVQAEPDPTDGPPDRPSHDCQIEEFVRDQHRSKSASGLLE